MDPLTAERKRPLFLTILCIISFLVCAFGAWVYFGYVFGDRAQQDLEKARADALVNMERAGPEAANDPLYKAVVEGQLGVLEEMAEHAKPMGIISLVYLAVTSIASVLMWKLKKVGFWLFAGVQVPGFLIPFIWIEPTVASLLMFGVSGFLWAGLIVLFALNLKHMR